MIRIIEKKTGLVSASVASITDAIAIVSIDPEGLMIDDASMLEDSKGIAKAAIIRHAEGYGEKLTAGYPLHEVLSWPVKIAEAQSIVAGDGKATPILLTECRFTGANIADVASTVLAKAGAFASASGAISGIRQAAIAKVDAATDEAGIRAALQWARETAEAAFGAIGR